MKSCSHFESPSSVDIKHDASNLLVEFVMINKYGMIAPHAWRKGQPLASEWAQVCKIIRRLLNTLKINEGRLGWYIWTTKVVELNYSEFGLVKWKIDKYFPFGNLHHIAARYKSQLEMAKANLAQDKDLQNVQYVPKEATSKKKKSLLDIIKELEHGE
jgi:hypothetical protein